MDKSQQRPAPFSRLKAGHPICKLADLADPGSREIVFAGSGDELLSIFLVRRGEDVFAYVNRCPHAGQRLNALPHDFLTKDKQQIQCDKHGALFDVATGDCLAGPCMGYALQAVPVRVENGVVLTASAS